MEAGSTYMLMLCRKLLAEEPLVAAEDEEAGEERVGRLLGPGQEEEEPAEEAGWG